MNRAERAFRSNANRANRDASVKRYNDFAAKIERSRSGSPKVANNTIVWYSNAGAIGYQLHATTLAYLNPNGSIDFCRHHWYTVTTQERLQRLRGYYPMTLAFAPECPRKEISWPYGEIPKTDIWNYSLPADMPDESDSDGRYGFSYPNGMSNWQVQAAHYLARRTAHLHKKYGTFENWQAKRREYLRECRRVAPLVREWTKTYTRVPQKGGLYYPGIGWDIKAKDNV